MWEILAIHQLYNTTTKGCMSCLNEKLATALHKHDNILNKRTKILSKCAQGTKTTWRIMTLMTNTKSAINSVRNSVGVMTILLSVGRYLSGGTCIVCKPVH